MIVPHNPSVPAVERTLTLFELLGHSKRGFSLSEISQRLALPKSSVHLIVTTLERRGYLQKNLHTGQYRFGVKLVGLSRVTLDSLELREEAKPFLKSLVSETGLTVHMAVLQRNEAVIIEKIEAPGLSKVVSWIGRRLEIHCTAVGKALVAFIPDDEFDRKIGARGFIKHNHKTITCLSQLKQELARVRQLGYSLDDEEEELGSRCIGAAVFNNHEKVVAAVSVAGTASQIPIEQVQTLARKVKQEAAAISAQLGFIEIRSSQFHQVQSTPYLS